MGFTEEWGKYRGDYGKDLGGKNGDCRFTRPLTDFWFGYFLGLTICFVTAADNIPATAAPGASEPKSRSCNATGGDGDS